MSALHDGKKLIKYTFIGLLIASFIAYLIEFIVDQGGRHDFGYGSHRGNAGFIFLFIFILIFIILGLVAGFLDHAICALVFVIGFLTLVIVDGLFIGTVYAVVIGALTLILGAVFTFMIWK